MIPPPNKRPPSVHAERGGGLGPRRGDPQGTLSGPPPPTQQQGWCPKPPFRLRGMYGGLGTPSPPLGALSHPGPGILPGDRANPDPSDPDISPERRDAIKGILRTGTTRNGWPTYPC